MKRFLLLLVFLLSVVVAHGQVSTQNARRIRSGTAVPSGACTVGPPFTDVYIRTTDHSVYQCTAASTWTLVIAGSTPNTGSGTSGQFTLWNGTNSLTGDSDATFSGDTATFTKIGATTFTGILTSNAATTFAQKIIKSASGTFGAAAVIGWYRADGTTNEGFVGYSSGDSQVLRLAGNQTGSSIEFQVDAQSTALTLAATTKLATFAGAIAAVGKISTYNNIATEGYGVAAIQKSPAITGNQSGGVTVTTITPTVSGSVYRVWGVYTSTSGTNTGTVGFTLDYLDTQATTHTADIIPVVGAAGAFATTGTAASKEFHTAPYLITVNSGTAITLKTVVTGTVQYTVTGLIEQVR